LAATVGVVSGGADLLWLINNLNRHDYLEVTLAMQSGNVRITGTGWDRIAKLRETEEASRYAFFARKFDNADLDTVFERCLLPAVRSTGFELRTVTQRAGLVDAIIEDEIRRCAFVLADLSDDNPGAYWEAGFAEGLGKPVIYFCKALEGTSEKRTHFDANHRHTVRWDLRNLDEASAKLKAVIRNTLLGRAMQSDT
jgi:nucleoside 2-deoxyribosyltransferase